MDIAHDVKSVIAKALKIPIEHLADETKLEDLGAESIDVIEMVFELEEKFDITISLSPTMARPTFSTVGDVSRAVKKLVDAKVAQ
ncbi:MAG TPA: phosphopantetheine-binding protein [Sphingomicrobium sp.]|nr:phosphopantetheine-binding protein [Sphingomicrobium sp.]